MRFVAITRDVFAQDGKSYVTVWVQADYASGTPSVKSPDELSEVGWFAWNALPEPRFLPLRHLIAGECWPRGANQQLGPAHP